MWYNPLNHCLLMDNTNRRNNRQWKVLYWNVWGINSAVKWSTIRSKIRETNCEIIYLQETKREVFDHSYLWNLYPPELNCFKFVSSVGNLRGGTLIVWKSSRFSGEVVFQNSYAMSVEFTSLFLGASWILSNIYAPCTPEGRQSFLD
jgi:hypothetical protein